jgi:putative ABC transport system substrate-binding protein
LSTHYPEISAKQVDLLKEMLPRLGRIAVFGVSTNPGNGQALRETELAAAGLSVQINYFDVKVSKDIESAFRAASKERRDAVLVLNGPIFNSNRKFLTEIAAKNRLPTMYYAIEFVEDGGLMTYGVKRSDLYRRAATYVDKILKGAKPADLPVEQPTKFELVINRKAAKQIGLASSH